MDGCKNFHSNHKFLLGFETFILTPFWTLKKFSCLHVEENDDDDNDYEVNDVDNDGGNNNDNDDDDDVVQVTYCNLTKLNWYVQ